MFSLIEIIQELRMFLKERKKFWLFPVVFLLIMLGLIVIFAETSAFGSLIYTVL